MVVFPTGTVTFLFTDLEVSTRLWEQEPDAMRAALARHDEMLHDAVASHGGMVVKGRGDGIHAVFATADAAVRAAIACELAMDAEQWRVSEPLRVRVGLHTGVAELRDGDYYGSAVNRAARLMDLAHGGQVVCSQATADLSRDVLVEGVAFVDLGEHRLRDLTRPERVFQVSASGLQDNFGPLASVDAFPGNLPLQVSSFIGRERDIARTVEALESARVVTLTGVGGVGKTRLALQVAAQLLPRFREGAWLVELAPVRDPAGVVDAFAAEFAVSARGGQTIAEAFVEFLGTKQLLLVIDNCEHLLDAVARLVAMVERSCAGVVVLATSREGLALDGERVVPVPSLSAPEESDELATVAASEAVQLFVDRAGAADPEFTLDTATAPGVRQVCRRLDGVPLAIELAAAQVTVMSPAELAHALDQRFDVLAGGRRGGIERHQTLRATIDWSYELLTEAHQRLLARLAVFAGGCTREGAEAICSGDPIAETAARALLRDLVAGSLVVAERGGPDTRYRLLETIRAYGEERLAEHHETRLVRDRHANYYLERCRALMAVLAGPDQIEWAKRLEAEHENLLAAMNHAIDTRNLDIAVSLAVFAAAFTLFETGYWLRLPVEPVIALPEARTHPGYPHALQAAALFASLAGDLDRAQQLMEEAAGAAADLDDDSFDNPYPIELFADASVRFNLAISRGDWRRGAQVQLESAERARTLDLPNREQYLGAAAWALSMAGDHETAISVATEALEVARANGIPTHINAALVNLAQPLADRDPQRARALLQEATQRSATLGYESLTELTMSTFAAARLGDWPLTARLAGQLIRHQHWNNQRVGLIGSLNAAACALADSDPAAAATLIGAARQFAPPAPTAPHPSAPTPDIDPTANLIVTLRRQASQQARDKLGDDQFRQLRDHGAAMDPDSAVAYALAHLDDYLTRNPDN
jgi:predicted ATPase/class 3 adenylate cyclase